MVRRNDISVTLLIQSSGGQPLKENYSRRAASARQARSLAQRPVSRELPVDPYHNHRWGFPCCVCSPMRTCHRHYPDRFDDACSAPLSPL